MIDLEPAPETLLKFIQCKCKLSTTNPCGNNTCSCHKHGLKCVIACGDCRGESCRNAEETIYNNYDDYSCDSNVLFSFYSHLSFIITQQKYTKLDNYYLMCIFQKIAFLGILKKLKLNQA